MAIPSENKNQVHRTRQEPDPTAFSVKPELDEETGAGLRGDDKRQGDLHQLGRRLHRQVGWLLAFEND